MSLRQLRSNAYSASTTSDDIAVSLCACCNAANNKHLCAQYLSPRVTGCCAPSVRPTINCFRSHCHTQARSYIGDRPPKTTSKASRPKGCREVQMEMHHRTGPRVKNRAFAILRPLRRPPFYHPALSPFYKYSNPTPATQRWPPRKNGGHAALPTSCVQLSPGAAASAGLDLPQKLDLSFLASCGPNQSSLRVATIVSASAIKASVDPASSA